jgi:hypothetical protein
MLATLQFRILCLPFWYLKPIKIKIYRTKILHVVLYGCETWSATLREEQRLKGSANKTLDLKRGSDKRVERIEQ